MKDDKRYYNSYNFDGNAARNLQVVPDHNVEIEPLRRQQPDRSVQKRRKANPGMDAITFLFFAFAIALTFYTCIEYLNKQSSITQKEKTVVELESQLMKLENDNKAALSQLNTSLDLNYIYQVATKELGMVYPDKNQVITYESTVSDYVRQYEDIPESSDTTLVGKILN